VKILPQRIYLISILHIIFSLYDDWYGNHGLEKMIYISMTHFGICFKKPVIETALSKQLRILRCCSQLQAGCRLQPTVV
jgi:hypothetical protein